MANQDTWQIKVAIQPVKPIVPQPLFGTLLWASKILSFQIDYPVCTKSDKYKLCTSRTIFIDLCSEPVCYLQ